MRQDLVRAAADEATPTFRSCNDERHLRVPAPALILSMKLPEANTRML